MKTFGRWKSFDFGPETSVDENKSPPKKLKCLSQTVKEYPIENRSKNVPKKRNFDFQSLIYPKIITDLSVHTKKIQEVEGWLKFAVTNPLQNKKKSQFLLLTGPTGCGKTATIHVLCKIMNVAVSEWINPVDIDYGDFRGPGQVTKFLEFFTEAKYPSLFGSENEKKILLVKDFPNVFIRNSNEFFNVLEECRYKTICPVVFICTDTGSKDVNLQKLLFPNEIQSKYSITHFSFNPCAPTLLKTALKRAQNLISEYPQLFKVPSPETFDAILASSMGDIRCAMNQFYMASLIGSDVLPTTKSKLGIKRKRKDQSKTLQNMVRDEALGLFHGLGRVLNPKRREEGNKWRIDCDIQKLVDEFSIQPAVFISFLFENYIKYFGDLEDVEKSADVLSLSTKFISSWDNSELLIQALWIAVLGLMVFNKHKVSKWNQIKGPRKLEKICPTDDQRVLHPTDRFYYNIITETQKYHNFNCDL